MHANRCPNCGSLTTNTIIDVLGRRYRKCTTGLTAFRKDGSKVPWIDSCNTVIDEHGEAVGFDASGQPTNFNIVFRTFDAHDKPVVKSITVNAGHEVR